MKKIGIVLIILALALFSIGAQLSLFGPSQKTNFVSTAYVNSQTDTLTWVRSGNEAGMTFWVKSLDSLCLDDVIVRRQFRGGLATVIAGDTIIGSTAATAAAIAYGSITLAPYCDTLKIIVSYADSANGVTTATATYGIVKQY